MFNVVSPFESHDKPGGHVFIDLFRQIFIEHVGAVKIFGNGGQERSFVDVNEVAGAIAFNLFNPATTNQIFNLGSAYPISVTALAELMIRIGHEQDLLPLDYSPSITPGGVFSGAESSRRLADLAKVERLLGWQAKIRPEDCFRELICTKLAII
jgi:dTDP-L-rhamnose 4-epimerase